MNPEIKTKWIDALKMGRIGNEKFYQGFGGLHFEDYFCSIGVLCELYAQEKNLEWVKMEGTTYLAILGNHAHLPEEIRTWAGVDKKAEEQLISLNDSSRKPFKFIADWIKTNL